MTIVYIILASLFISLGALAGVMTLAMNQEKLSHLLLFFVSLSAGSMMGGAFIHLLPEAAESLSADVSFGIVLLSFITFFLIEKIFHWRHCHQGHCHVHTFGYMNLVGDFIHNFIDGLILAGTFMIDIKLGIVTTLAVALHEIPQEIGDFGVLLYAGFSQRKALITNFLVALSTVAGSIVGYLLATQSHNFVPFLLPFAAGGFIYISASDLMPEIRKETNLKKSLLSFAIFIAGVLMMWLVKQLGGE